MRHVFCLIPVLFLLVPMAFAFSEECSDYVFIDTADFQCVGGSVPPISPASDSLLSSQGWTINSARTSMRYRDFEDKLGNMSISTIGSVAEHDIDFDIGLRDNVTIQIMIYDNPADTSAYSVFRIEDDSGGGLFGAGIKTGITSTEYVYWYSGAPDYIASGISRVASWVNFTFHIAPNNAYGVVYINNIKIYNDTSSASMRFLHLYEADSPPITLNYDNIYIWNGSLEDRPELAPPPDTCTAPGSGDWDVDCADNCVLDSAQDVVADMHLNGIGTIVLSSYLTFLGTGSILSIGSGCTLDIRLGGQIGGT